MSPSNRTSMSKVFNKRIGKTGLNLVDPLTHRIIASIETKPWETQFFNRKVGALSIEPGVASLDSDYHLPDILNELLAFADENVYDLIDLHMEVTNLKAIPFLEDFSFELVDTKITFMTEIDQKSNRNKDHGAYDFRPADQEMLGELLKLTDISFTENDSFYSRFKNPDYYSPDESKKYYRAWIENHLEDKDAIFVTAHMGNRVAGYSIYKYAGIHKRLPIYKSILAAVSPEDRGKKLFLTMQPYCYSSFGKNKFYLDNTTQLTNYAAIRNSITARKSLDRIGMIFYRKKQVISTSSDGLNV